MSRKGYFSLALILWAVFLTGCATQYQHDTRKGFAYLDKEHFNSAIKWFNKAIKEDPMSPLAYVGRGQAYYGKGDFDAAVENFNTAILMLHDDETAYLWRGLAYAEIDQPDRAFRDFNKAIEINEYSYDAYYNRALLYLRLKKFDEAEKDIQALEWVKTKLEGGEFLQNTITVLRRSLDIERSVINSSIK